SIVVSDRSGLTIDGNGSTFQALTQGAPGRDNWRIQGGSDVTLENMVARGANPHAGINDLSYDPHFEWQHAFRFGSTLRGVLDNVSAYDVYGDFVEAEFDLRGSISTSPPARDITVRNSRFQRSGRQGFGLTDVDGFHLTNSFVGNVNMAAIDIE